MQRQPFEPAIVGIILLALSAVPIEASHLRYGSVGWTRVLGSTTDIEVCLTLGYRDYSGQRGNLPG